MAGHAPEDFTLLGHHLEILTDLMPPIGLRPDEIARINREKFVKSRGDITAAIVDWRALHAPADSPEYEAAYAFSMVGETADQADRYEHALRGELSTFMSLDDEATVLLIAKGLDGICRSCAFLNHCQRPDSSGLDAQYIDLFGDALDFASVNARRNGQSLHEFTMRLPDGNMLTSAKAVREVAALFAIGGIKNKADFYKDALECQRQHGSMRARLGKAAIVKYYEAGL